MEVRVSEIRRLAGCVEIDHSRRDAKRRPLHITRPLPDERPARNGYSGGGGGRIAAGVFIMPARLVNWLHQTRQPRRLAGDLRTTRANVMRQGDRSQATGVRDGKRRGFKCRINRAEPVAWPPDRGVAANPNAGASRTKMIGLRADWSQPIRIEKWIFPRRIRPAYFMVCPNRKSRIENPKSHPPLSTRRPGREHPSTKKCPQRCLKLMMVQCTPAESRDADLAQLWINSIPRSLIPKYRDVIHRLEARYGAIFEPRVLLCPRCLGVKYGNNPETVRQGWRRRNRKPDTSVAANIGSVEVKFNHWSRPLYEQSREAIERAGLRGDGQAAQRRKEKKRRLAALAEESQHVTTQDILRFLQREPDSSASRAVSARNGRHTT